MFSMTGRERILAVFNRQPNDRPPFDFWAEDATVNRLSAYLGYHDIERFLDEMDVDVRAFQSKEPAYKQLGVNFYENIWGERFTFRETGWGPMREDSGGALTEAKRFEDFLDYAWPSNDIMSFDGLVESIRHAKNHGRAIRYGYGDVWQRASQVRGMENHMVDMLLNPEWTHFMSRKLTDFYLEDYRRAWEISGGAIDYYFVCSDVGSQNGPLISVAMFNEFVSPYIRELANMVHKFGAKLLYHSCGDVSSFIPAIIDCGVDILNPLQPTCAAMQPEALVRYADRLLFHGGVDVQHLLPVALPEQVRETVRYYASVLSPGYIMSSTHFIQPDTPPENIIAMYQAYGSCI